MTNELLLSSSKKHHKSIELESCQMAKISSVFLWLFMQDYSYSQLSSLCTAQGTVGAYTLNLAEWRRVYTCHNTWEIFQL